MAETEKKEPLVSLHVMLPPKLSRRVNAYAEKHHLQRTSAVIMLLGQGLENAGQSAIDADGN
jgi:hypothetical protein